MHMPINMPLGNPFGNPFGNPIGNPFGNPFGFGNGMPIIIIRKKNLKNGNGSPKINPINLFSRKIK